jgi:hypothetical protein
MREKKSRPPSVKSLEECRGEKAMREYPLSLEELETELARPGEPILVAFGADGWRPSEAMLERVRPIAEDAGIRMVMADPIRAAIAYRLFTLPTLLLFSRGEERVRIQGMRGRRAILRKLGPWLESSQQRDVLRSGTGDYLPREDSPTPA